jgi:uncharacterized protein with PIN domain
MIIVKAYSGRKLAYTSEFSDDADIDALVQEWRKHCRVVVTYLPRAIAPNRVGGECDGRRSDPEQNAELKQELGGEPEMKFHNFYRCPECGTEWDDCWDSMCNDECPECGIKDIEPYRSEELEAA